VRQLAIKTSRSDALLKFPACVLTATFHKADSTRPEKPILILAGKVAINNDQVEHAFDADAICYQSQAGFPLGRDIYLKLI
jgi:hypothetical protein